MSLCSKMMSGAYSQRYKNITDHHVDELKKRHQSERSHMLARARKVQLETNRRRRALALKKKQGAQREEERKQEILAKRKQQIREATEKFQRANTHYQTIDTLYEGNRDHHRQATPALEEALKLVRGSSGLRRSLSYDGIAKLSSSKSSKSHRPHSNYEQTQNERIQEHVQHVAARTELQGKSIRNLTNSRSLFEQQLEHHQNQLQEQQRASLHHFNSAIQDEVQGRISNHDDRLQHSDSLSSVDSLEADREPLSQSDTSAFNYKQNLTDITREGSFVNTYSSPSLDYRNNSPSKQPCSSNNFASSYSNRNSNSPTNIAIVQPNNAQQGSSHLTSIQNNTDPSKYNVPQSDSMSGTVSGAKSIITNDTEFLKSLITKAQQFNNSAVNYAQAPTNYVNNFSSISKNYEVNSLSGGPTPNDSAKEIVKTRLKAWATPSPVDSSHAQTISVADNSMINNNPTGVKATSTYQTVTTHTTSVTHTKPPSSWSSHTEGNISNTSNSQRSKHPKQTEPSSPSYSRFLSGSYYTVKSYAEQSRPQSHVLVESQTRPVVSSQSHNSGPSKADYVVEDNDSIDEEHETDIPPQKLPPSPVKSILRKISSYSDKLRVKGSGYSASLAKQRSHQHGASPGGITATVSVRDSLEVARHQIESRQEVQKPTKKSVRFTDHLEQEEPDEGEKKNEEEKEEEKPLVRRPPRPVSSTTKTTESNGTKSASRTQSSSASMTRSGIPINKNNTVSSKKPPAAPTNQRHSHSQPTVKDIKDNKRSDGTYDMKGLKLDRTPTDDEINLLWDHVRDCLSRSSSIVESAAGDSGAAETKPSESRTSHQSRADDQNHPQNHTPYINGTNSHTNRKKVTMEHLTNYSAKKTNALQRQQQNRFSQKGAPSPVGSAGYNTQSSTFIPQNYHKEVSDSMATFLTAELLSNRSTSASQINNAMDAIHSREPVFSSARPQQKGHSALSIEEQRLLQSLETLNERLRMTEQTLNPTKIYVPHPPTQTPSFRNQTINQRRISGVQSVHSGKSFR